MPCPATTLKGERCKNSVNCRVHLNFVKTPFCKEKLQQKIRINIAEYNNGRWVSPQQAVAVSYRQTEKKFPQCK